MVSENMRPDLIFKTGSNTTIVLRWVLHKRKTPGELLGRSGGSSGVIGTVLLE